MQVYNVFSEYLKNKYGTKVYKLPIGLPVTCPNRDGTCGVAGCAFCGEIGAGYENLPAEMTIAAQIAANKAHIVPKYKAEKFIAYLQNYTNTYLPLALLEDYIVQCCQEDVVAVYIATRPDCISKQYAEKLAELRDRLGVDICVEMGLQTVNYHTLQSMGRGHTLAEFIDAVLCLRDYGLLTCAHIILGLPGDSDIDAVETAKVISALRVDQVKIHALYIVKDSRLAREYSAGRLEIITCEEYKSQVIKFLEYLRPNIIVQRLIGRAPASHTLFSNWQIGWWQIRDDIIRRMQAEGRFQGRLCAYLDGSALGNMDR